MGQSQVRPSYLSNALGLRRCRSRRPVRRPPARSCRRTPPARSHAALLHDADDHRTHGSTRRKSAPVGGGIGGGGRLWSVGRGRVPWRVGVGSVVGGSSHGARGGGAPPRERTDRRPCDIPTGLEPGRWPCTRGGRGRAEAERRRSGVRRQSPPRRERDARFTG